MNAGTGFIKSYMTVITNSQYLQINTTCVFYHFLVLLAIGLELFLFYFTIRDMDVLWVNIYMIKKIGAHEAVIALQRIIIYRVIFVEIESDDIFKAQLFFFMQPYQLTV